MKGDDRQFRDVDDQEEQKNQGLEAAEDEAGAENGERRRPEQSNKKAKRQIKPRFKFESKQLRDSRKGLRLLYDSTNRLKLDSIESQNSVISLQLIYMSRVIRLSSLNQFLRLYKEWHFNLVPKYELGYFISRCHEFGTEPDIKVDLLILFAIPYYDRII